MKAILREPHIHVDDLQILTGGFSSLHFHRSKMNWFILRHGLLAVSLYKPGKVQNTAEIESIHWLQLGVPFSVAAGVLHRFACLSECHCTEVYWPAASGIAISEDDIVRLNCHGLSASNQLAEAIARNCLDGNFA